MGQALYRKYRSKNLGEIVGQEHITGALNNALKSGKISHAYLFTGPHGVGKTSIARILAYEVNGLPYDETHQPIDIIEIDAASNRRIDEIRDLRDKVHIAPTSAKYKVYIIDEVHMLTKEAFNALLKTLEEPPAHVIFILATTEAHKLPETIISRTQRYIFRPVTTQKAAEHLRVIADKEKIDIDDAALKIVAEHGDGSFRDSISLLDQISNLGKSINAQDLLSLLGIAPAEAIDQLKTILFDGTPKDIANTLADLRDRGFEPSHIAKQLGESLRKELINNHSQGPAITKLLCQLLDVAAAADGDALLEVRLIGFNLDINPVIQSAPKPIAKTPHPTAEPTPTPTTKHEIQEISAPESATPPKTIPANPELSDFWPNTLAALKQKYNTLYGVLRMAQPTLDGDTLTLSFKFAFHQKRVNEPRNQQILNQTIQKLSGQTLTVKCIINQDTHPTPTPKAEPPSQTTTSAIANISNIFGGAEVLES